MDTTFYLFIQWWLTFGLFPLLWTVVPRYLCGNVFNSLGCMSRRKIAGSYTNFMFNFLRNCQAVLQGVWAILPSYQQYTRVPISTHPPQHLLLSYFYDNCPNGCKVVSQRSFHLCFSKWLLIQSSGPQPFWHQNRSRGRLFFQTGVGVGVGVGGTDGSGGNTNDGEQQMKLQSLAHHSFPAVPRTTICPRPGDWGSLTECIFLWIYWSFVYLL